MMKVKCIENYGNKLTAGEVYKVTGVNGDYIRVLCDDGFVDGFSDMYLEPIPETPQIEVGSEWVNEDGDVYKIKYASDKTVVYGEDEVCVDTDYFLDMFKPKPKTVKMYFYTDCNGLTHAYSEPMPVFGDYKFTKEIEI